MTERSYWDAPPLSAEDQKLVEAYLKTGRSFDDLPYTKEFEDLFAQLSAVTLESKHFIFQRLLRLRKSGRLPRPGQSSTEAY